MENSLKEAEPKVELLYYTPEPEISCATAARLCYSKVGISELRKKMSLEDARKLLRKIISMGHFSTLEHAIFTFGIEGVSRAMTHQLVRHRIASYNQQSQRYVKLNEFSFIVPKTIKAKEELYREYLDIMQKCHSFYNKLLNENIPAQDARFVLPNACETKIVVTMNARSLYNFFEKRCCNRAQWEIRAVANKMLELCKKVAPVLFEKAGPSCISKGVCYEGKMSCGMWKKVGAVLKEEH